MADTSTLVQLGGIVGSTVIVTTGAMLWLTHQFAANRKVFYEGFEKIAHAFREHEKEDQKRHEDNLVKFERITSELRRRNGTGLNAPDQH